MLSSFVILKRHDIDTLQVSIKKSLEKQTLIFIKY